MRGLLVAPIFRRICEITRQQFGCAADCGQTISNSKGGNDSYGSSSVQNRESQGGKAGLDILSLLAATAGGRLDRPKPAGRGPCRQAPIPGCFTLVEAFRCGDCCRRIGKPESRVTFRRRRVRGAVKIRPEQVPVDAPCIQTLDINYGSGAVDIIRSQGAEDRRRNREANASNLLDIKRCTRIA